MRSPVSTTKRRQSSMRSPVSTTKRRQYSMRSPVTTKNKKTIQQEFTSDDEEDGRSAPLRRRRRYGRRLPSPKSRRSVTTKKTIQDNSDDEELDGNLLQEFKIIIIIDNFCIALFSGVPKLTALYVLQHFLSFTNIIHIIMTTNNV